MKNVNISIPAVEDAKILELSQATVIAIENETVAFKQIRESYADYAKHNGFIRIGFIQPRYVRETSYYLMNVSSNKKIHGLLIGDDFAKIDVDEYSAKYEGSRLYLTEYAEWLEIERVGFWNQEKSWRGDQPRISAAWGCGDNIIDSNWVCENNVIDSERWPDITGGKIVKLTDAGVVEAGWSLESIIEQLAATMKDFVEKINQRHNKLRHRAQLATTVIAELTKK